MTINNSKKTAEKIVEAFTDFTLPVIKKEEKTNNDFMKDLVKVSNIVRRILLTSSQICSTQIPAYKAEILAGHMVRIFKLYDTYILMIVEKRGELAFIISRCLTETIINFEYLLKYLNTEVFKKYKRASLSLDRKFKKFMVDYYRERGLGPKPLQDKMVKSLNKTFKRSGLRLEENELKKTEWGLKKEHLKISGKAKDVGLYEIYELIFKRTSAHVHGSWHDLDFNHLSPKKDKSGMRYPNVKFMEPMPHMLFAPSIMALNATIKYWNMIGFNDFNPRIQKVIEWFQNMAEQHKDYLIKTA